ncbi:hypothetical protein [Pseudoalteromonas rubra]|uniref:hypothetical protein n=1 Tax=Pseudoalteromonas rubra TaxID=43658 RepID=UPI002DB7B128|nr:hypothetical protein [Pseudoalteromonas rubra]MEC4091869.1 hypothetical protein [Pseudoalteromonas rubra]
MQNPKNMETIEATEIALEIVKFGVECAQKKGLRPSSRPFEIALQAVAGREVISQSDLLLAEAYEAE